MTENSAPESADEETPDAGEGEPEDATETTAHEESPEAPEPGGDETGPGTSEANEAEPADEGADAAGDDDAAVVDDAAVDEDTDYDDETADDETADDGRSREASDATGTASADATDRTEAVPEPDIPDDVAAEATGGDVSGADSDGSADVPGSAAADSGGGQAVPEDVQKYARFQKMDGAQYERVNEFLRERTYVTAREWAIARLCADFRTETGVEMTKIGQNLPRLVPFMTDTYTPQAVNQARASFEEKVNKAGATFLYGAMCGFFTAEELDEMMYEVTEVAKFLLEVEGVDLSVEEELAAEDKISEVMREVRQSSAQVRGEEVECPECGHVHDPN